MVTRACERCGKARGEENAPGCVQVLLHRGEVLSRPIFNARLVGCMPRRDWHIPMDAWSIVLHWLHIERDKRHITFESDTPGDARHAVMLTVRYAQDAWKLCKVSGSHGNAATVAWVHAETHGVVWGAGWGLRSTRKQSAA